MKRFFSRRRNAALLFAAVSLAAGKQSLAINWNADHPTYSAISANGLTDRPGLFTNECYVGNSSNSTRGTATYLGNGWVLTAQHVVQNGGDYNTLAAPSQIVLVVGANGYQQNYVADQVTTPSGTGGGADIALFHIGTALTGPIATLAGVQESQINTSFSEAGSMAQIGGLGIWGHLGAGAGTENTSVVFHHAYNIIQPGLDSHGNLMIAANGDNRLVNNGYLLGQIDSGDSGSAIWIDTKADSDSNLVDYSIAGVTATGSGNDFGSVGTFTRVANYAGWLTSTAWGGTPSTLTWDSNTSTSAVQDGGGTWDLVHPNFSTGIHSFNWNNSTTINAKFGANNGAAGTVTLGQNTTVQNLMFSSAISGNYTIAGGGFALAISPTTAITTFANATISAPLTGAGATISKAGAGTLTLSGNNTYTGTTIINEGTIQVSGGSTGTTGADIQIGPVAGANGTLTVSGGTVNAARVIVGGDSGNDNGGVGVVNQSGGVINSTQWFSVGSGTPSGAAAVGTFNMTGGTLNVNGGSVAAQMEVGNFSNATGTVNMSGASSQINILRNGYIAILSSPNSLSGTFNQNGGTVTFYSDNGVTPGGTGGLAIGAANGSGTAVYALNGGTLNVPVIGHYSGNMGTAKFYFNGGTLQPSSSSAIFMQNLTSAIVQGGGAIVSVPAGLSPTINQPLIHDSALGTTKDGGLTKSGAGMLTLTSTANTYTGPTVISGGTLKLIGDAPIASYNFKSVAGGTVANSGVGGTAMNATLNGAGASVNTSAGPIAGTGALTLNGSGSSLDVASPITDLGGTGTWTVSMWVKTSQAGATLFNKGNGSGWTTGYSTFYLGTTANNGPGAGGVPDAVRYAGGWMAGSAAVNDGNWHLLTYTDNAGVKSIYTDGTVANTVALEQGGFGTADTGSMIRFGFAPNPGDGAANLNGSLSDINFYAQALTAAQIQSLYASNVAGTNVSNVIPSGTPVSLTSSTATLDIESANQTVGSLNGVAGSSVVLGSGSTVTVNNTTSSEFDGVISGTGNLTVQNSGIFTLGGSNTFTGLTTVGAGSRLNVNGTLAATGAITASGMVSFTANAGAGILARPSGAITLKTGGVVQVQDAASHANRTVLVASALSFGGSTGAWQGKMDLGGNDLVVKGGNLTNLNNQLQQGFNVAGGGYWNGSAGIVSSTAAADASHLTTLGIIQNNDGTNQPIYGSGTAYGLFDGQNPSINDVLIKYTYFGDADLSGHVDGTDYAKIDNGFNNHLTGWFNGDFNYDGQIDGSDYSLIDNAFNTQGATLSDGTLMAPASAMTAASTAEIGSIQTAVPEPGTLWMGIMLGAATMRRRGVRRRVG